MDYLNFEGPEPFLDNSEGPEGVWDFNTWKMDYLNFEGPESFLENSEGPEGV